LTGWSADSCGSTCRPVCRTFGNSLGHLLQKKVNKRVNEFQPIIMCKYRSLRRLRGRHDGIRKARRCKQEIREQSAYQQNEAAALRPVRGVVSTELTNTITDESLQSFVETSKTLLKSVKCFLKKRRVLTTKITYILICIL